MTIARQPMDNPNPPHEKDSQEVQDVKRATGKWARGLFEKVLEAKDKDEEEVREMLREQISDLQHQLASQADAHSRAMSSKDKRIMALLGGMILGWAAFTVVALVLFAHIAGFRGDVKTNLQTGEVKIEATD